jgi:hypothetical protein
MITTSILIFSLLTLIYFSYKILYDGNIFGLFFILLSILSIYLIIFPKVLTYLANFFGVGRGADLLLYLSFSTGIFLYIRILIKIKKLEIIITEIIRDNALKNAEK